MCVLLLHAAWPGAGAAVPRAAHPGLQLRVRVLHVWLDGAVMGTRVPLLPEHAQEQLFHAWRNLGNSYVYASAYIGGDVEARSPRVLLLPEQAPPLLRLGFRAPPCCCCPHRPTQQLFQARRMLGNSYVYAFYMFGRELYGDEISLAQNATNQNVVEDLHSAARWLQVGCAAPLPCQTGLTHLGHRV